MRKEVPFYDLDREIWPEIDAVKKMVYSGEILEIARQFIPDLY